MAVPASQTKHLPYLIHPLPRDPSTTLHIEQQQASSEGSSGTGTTGTTLWLGAQVMAAYLHDLIPTESEPRRIIDLGSGVGLLALILASAGHEVLATDVEPVLSGVLKRNTGRARVSGTVEVRGLDWFQVGEDWEWDWDAEEGGSLTTLPSEPRPAGQVPSKSIRPSFDYILTTDTLYHPTLLDPLLRTLQQLSTLPAQATPPPILVALERRDSALIDSALDRAKEVGFDVKRISKGRVSKAVCKAWGWEKDDEDWEGIEIWKWKWKGLGA